MSDIDKFFEDTLKLIKANEAELGDSEWISEPPTFKEFFNSGDYIPSVVLSPKQYESSIELLGDDPKKIFSPDRVKSLGIFAVGKGGGKDWLVSIIMCYVVTVLLHLKNPGRFLDRSGNIDMLCVALKAEQGEKVFFDYFKQNIIENKWFIDNYKIVDEGKIVNKPRIQFNGVIQLTKSSALFPKKIRCFSETSKNETWDGYNVIFFVLDEISGYMTEKGVENGWNVFHTAFSSCISRSTGRSKGIGCVISYPRKEKNDIILDLYEKARNGENPGMFGIRCFAWHFKLASKYSGVTFEFHNPRINRAFGFPDTVKKGIRVPIELKEAFDMFPERALTQYCALPPRATGNWIEYPDRILSAIDDSKPLFFTEDFPIIKVVEGVEYKFLNKKIVSCSEGSADIRRNYRYVAWLDSAEVHCDAVIVIARKETIITKDENDEDRPVEIVRIVDVINWLPEPGLHVDLVNVEDFLLTEIPKWINLKEVGKDRWESATLHNRLIKKGINSIRYNLLGRHYEIAKYFFYLGAVRIFDEEKHIARNKQELTSLEQMLALVNSAKGPEKKSDLKKDKSDGVVGCINLLMGDDFTKKNRPKTQKVGTLGNPVIGINNPYSRTNSAGVPSQVITGNNTLQIDEEKQAKIRKLGKPVKG